MTGVVTKGLAQRQDLDNYDGSLTTSRIDSTGGTLAGLKIGNEVDVLSVYGDGDTSNQTLATINDAIAVLGATNIALSFAPGTWAITDNLTIAANFTVVAPAGCVFDVSAGKTLTIAGVFFRQHDTYSSGSGTVTLSGTDLIPITDYLTGYAADTGTADAYVTTPSPAISTYAAGQRFSFKAANANTGAATLNVNDVGTQTIKKDVSTTLAANDITVGDMVTVDYDGIDFQLVPTVGVIQAVTTSVIPSGTLMLFQQTAAPTGWTKQTTHDNKGLRVVSGTASSGGNDSFSTVFGTSKSTASYTLLIADLPGHVHAAGSIVAANESSHTHGAGSYVVTGSAGASGNTKVGLNDAGTSTVGVTGTSGAGSAHTHTMSGNSASTGGDGGHSHDLTIDLQYIDLIIASKN